MSDFETVGGYLIKSLNVRNTLFPANRALAIMRIRHYELKFAIPVANTVYNNIICVINERQLALCHIMFERLMKLYEICYSKSHSDRTC